MSKSKNSVAVAPLVIEAASLSGGWAKLFLHVLENPGTEIAPLVLSIHGFDDAGIVEENDNLRSALDALLLKKGRLKVEDVAFTIFPQRFWKIVGENRAALFDLYEKSFGRMQEMNKHLNGRGLYFERMAMYGRGPCGGNQLEWIISQYQNRTGVRRSMMQATIFDPGRDHVASAQLGFPCLQHVSFEPTTAGLVVNAFYATQQIFDKSYGNYLGLTQLGAFMAQEMGLKLTRLNVFVGIAKLERITKSDPDMQNVISVSESLVVADGTHQSVVV